MLAAAPWARALPAPRLARIESGTSVRECASGSLVCRKGERFEHWLGEYAGVPELDLDGLPDFEG